VVGRIRADARCQQTRRARHTHATDSARGRACHAACGIAAAQAGANCGAVAAAVITPSGSPAGAGRHHAPGGRSKVAASRSAYVAAARIGLVDWRAAGFTISAPLIAGCRRPAAARKATSCDRRQRGALCPRLERAGDGAMRAEIAQIVCAARARRAAVRLRRTLPSCAAGGRRPRANVRRAGEQMMWLARRAAPHCPARCRMDQRHGLPKLLCALSPFAAAHRLFSREVYFLICAAVSGRAFARSRPGCCLLC
jgi:hypothetical protein